MAVPEWAPICPGDSRIHDLKPAAPRDHLWQRLMIIYGPIPRNMGLPPVARYMIIYAA